MTTKKTKTRIGLQAGLTVTRPAASRERGALWLAGDPEAVRPLQRGEGMPVFVASVFLALLALGVCYRAGYTLLYGDAVAHLGNARRILDSHYPGLSQLGGAWLPLPHLLMLPFIGNMSMWQTGLAAAPMSMLSFAASVVGVWRLARRMMRLRWALVATLFYALNPNLLYLATTAMTEALFLALFVWSVVGTVEGVAAIRAGRAMTARREMLFAGLMVLLMVFTRYDGWIVGAAVWGCFAWVMWRCEGTLRRGLLPVFGVFTVLCVAGPLLWFWYNAHFDGDWLDFMRGPYSARQIERRTAPPGQHYRGWHNPLWSAVFYLRTAQIDASVWETGWVLMGAAWWGTWLSWRRALLGPGTGRDETAAKRGDPGRTHPNRDEAALRMGHPDAVAVAAEVGYPGVVTAKVVGPGWGWGERFALLLWVPLPFYVYSIAFGSVPIFIPQLWPHSFYNARYGMELLPALSVYPALAAERVERWLRAGTARWQVMGVRFWQPAAMVLCVLNCLLMMHGTASFPVPSFLRWSKRGENPEAVRARVVSVYDPVTRRYAMPLVLQEGMVNARTRVPFERSLATVLETMPVDKPVLFSTSAHVGAVQDAGRALRTVISENDEIAWEAALKDPAHRAAYVIALEGDPVAKAVAAHPEGLTEIEVVRTFGQPTARIFQSTVYAAQATQ